MENLDLIILTSIISACFIVFIALTLKEFNYMGKNEFKASLKKESK